MKLNEIKSQIKYDPGILFKKPQYFIPLIIIAIKYLYNNIKYSADRVYFVETSISNYVNHNNRLLKEISGNDNYRVINIKDYNSFYQYIMSRQEEDSGAGISYNIEVQKRFLNRGEAFVLFYNNEPLGYIFVQFNDVIIPQVNMKYKQSNDTFTFIDLYILKKHRKKGYHEILYALAINQLRQHDYHYFYCWLMKHNHASIKAHIKIGISHITKIITRRSLFFLSHTTVKITNTNLQSLINSSYII
jgi:GNAT superfamily N-acetyltransferase